MRSVHSYLRLLAVAAILMVTAVAAPTAHGQAVDATLTLEKPAPGVSHAINRLRDADKPRVALLISDQNRDGDAAMSRGRDAVYSWEIFLLGLQLPYITVQDRDVAKGIDKEIDILIMPSADALSGSQRKSILKFVERGGGLIASGTLGQTDSRGRKVEDTFFGELLGAELVTRVPAQPYGLLHTVDAATPIGQGVPPGFRLNIAAQPNLSAAKAVTSIPLGTPISYSGRDDARLADLSLMLLNQKGKGWALWTRFGPQDVSRERAHQAAYQRMMVNAMALMAGSRTAAIRPWPNAARSALSIVGLPTVGFDPLSYLAGNEQFLSLLQSQRVPATFFLTTGEAIGFPDLVGMMGKNGEVALSAESDDVLLGQPLEGQAARMARAQSSLSGTFVGLYPPGGYYDGNTLRASVESGFNYVLLPLGSSLVPSVVRWWEDVDYRALQASATEQVDLAFLRSRRRQAAQPRQPAAEPTPTITVPLDYSNADYSTRFLEIERAGGLYALPFYPESETAGSARTGQLRDVLALARERGAWVATVNDVVRWWTLINNVSVDIADSGRELFAVDVTNRAKDTLNGVTIELRMGDVRLNGLESDRDAEVVAGDVPGTFLLIIDRLPAGVSQFNLSISR